MSTVAPAPTGASAGGWLIRAIDRLTQAAIALAFGIALLLACQEIAARYVVPESTLDWSFEVIVFLIIWAMFLAMSQLAARGSHIRVDLVMRLLPQGAQRAFSAFSMVLGIVIAIVLFVSGILVVSQSMEWDERTTSSLALPLWLYYLSLPVGAALLAVRLVARLADLVAGRIDHDDAIEAMD